MALDWFLLTEEVLKQETRLALSHFCDTTALHYLHQVGLLHILPALTDRVFIPPAVRYEIERGKERGLDLPELNSLDRKASLWNVGTRLA